MTQNRFSDASSQPTLEPSRSAFRFTPTCQDSRGQVTSPRNQYFSMCYSVFCKCNCPSPPTRWDDDSSLCYNAPPLIKTDGPLLGAASCPARVSIAPCRPWAATTRQREPRGEISAVLLGASPYRQVTLINQGTHKLPQRELQWVYHLFHFCLNKNKIKVNGKMPWRVSRRVPPSLCWCSLAFAWTAL